MRAMRLAAAMVVAVVLIVTQCGWRSSVGRWYRKLAAEYSAGPVVVVGAMQTGEGVGPAVAVNAFTWLDAVCKDGWGFLRNVGRDSIPAWLLVGAYYGADWMADGEPWEAPAYAFVEADDPDPAPASTAGAAAGVPIGGIYASTVIDGDNNSVTYYFIFTGTGSDPQVNPPAAASLWRPDKRRK